MKKVDPKEQVPGSVVADVFGTVHEVRVANDEGEGKIVPGADEIVPGADETPEDTTQAAEYKAQIEAQRAEKVARDNADNFQKNIQLYSASVLVGKHIVSPVIEHLKDGINDANQDITLINRFETELPELGQSALVSTAFYGLKALGVQNNLFASAGVYAVSMYNNPTAYNFVSTSYSMLYNIGLMKAVVGLGLVSATASTSSVIGAGLLVGAGYEAGKLAYSFANKLSNDTINTMVEDAYESLDTNVKLYVGHDIATLTSEKFLVESTLAGISAMSDTAGQGYELLDNNVKHYTGHDIATLTSVDFLNESGLAICDAVTERIFYVGNALAAGNEMIQGYFA